MPFREYTPTRTRPGRIGATALNTGSIQLSTTAYRALGEPEIVTVAVDPDECLIRVRVGTPDHPGALHLQQQRRFAATRLLRTAGIAYRPISVHLPGRQTARTEIVLDYGDAPTAQTRRTAP